MKKPRENGSGIIQKVLNNKFKVLFGLIAIIIAVYFMLSHYPDSTLLRVYDDSTSSTSFGNSYFAGIIGDSSYWIDIDKKSNILTIFRASETSTSKYCTPFVPYNRDDYTHFDGELRSLPTPQVFLLKGSNNICIEHIIDDSSCLTLLKSDLSPIFENKVFGSANEEVASSDLTFNYNGSFAARDKYYTAQDLASNSRKEPGYSMKYFDGNELVYVEDARQWTCGNGWLYQITDTEVIARTYDGSQKYTYPHGVNTEGKILGLTSRNQPLFAVISDDSTFLYSLSPQQIIDRIEFQESFNPDIAHDNKQHVVLTSKNESRFFLVENGIFEEESYRAGKNEFLVSFGELDLLFHPSINYSMRYEKPSLIEIVSNAISYFFSPGSVFTTTDKSEKFIVSSIPKVYGGLPNRNYMVLMHPTEFSGEFPRYLVTNAKIDLEKHVKRLEQDFPANK